MKLRNPFTAVWDYFRPSWEGDDGKFSYKRASQFVFTAILAYMAVTSKVHEKYSWYVFITIGVLFALTAAIISVPQLITLAKLGLGFKGTAAADINSLTHETDQQSSTGADTSTGDSGAADSPK